MNSEDGFQLPFTLMVLTSLFFVWVLKTMSKKSKANLESFSKQNLRQNHWRPIFTTITKWYWNKSATKNLMIEESRLVLKTLAPHGSPKLVKLFPVNLVINDDIESIKSILTNKKIETQNPETLAHVLSNDHRRGLLYNDGPVWKELRRYTIKTLGVLGFGKSGKLSCTLSDILQDVLAQMESAKSTHQNKIPIKNVFLIHNLNIIWGIIGGKKFSQGDQNVEMLQQNFSTIVNCPLWKLYLLTLLPSNKLLHYLLGYKSLYESVARINNYFTDFVNKKMASQSESAEPEDFVEHFLVAAEKYKNNEEMKHIYCKKQLVAILEHLFVGGLDGTSTYLELSLMYMIQNPDIQRKVHEEIDLVIGKDHPSFWDHRQSTPYICATLMEIHRMGSIAPTISRYTPNDVEHNGQIIEKGTQILNIMWALRMDETFWGDPKSFRPERFLDENKEIIMDKYSRVMPFGAGIRICPAENVSNAYTYTLFTGLMQKYSVTKAFENEELGLVKYLNTLNHVLPFHVSLHNR